jgi:hypothetical protein
MKVDDPADVASLILQRMLMYVDDYTAHKTTTGSQLLTFVFENGIAYNVTITKARKP